MIQKAETITSKKSKKWDLAISDQEKLCQILLNDWSREYLIESKKTKNPAENEIFIDFELAQQCLIKGAQWPLLANTQGRSGELRESDKNITLNGPR